MLKTLEACSQLWNDALSHRRNRWQNQHKPTSYSLQQWILTEERRADPALRMVYSQAAQDVLRRLDKSFKAFFDHGAGYPKFKKRGDSGFGSFTYPQAYHGSVKPDTLRKRLFLSKIGNVRCIFHRHLPNDALLKTCTVVREPSGKWYASLIVEDTVPLQDIEVPTKALEIIPSPIEIDLGLKALITTSDGESVPHPKFLLRAERRLKHLQRTFSRKKKGSKNRFKARKRVATLHAKVSRQRADFHHKLSRRLVRDHGLIAFEDLRVRNMVRNHSLAKSIHDAGWDQLVEFTEYKAASNRGIVVRVDPAYSTQECNYCGALNPVSLDIRRFICHGCGRSIERDVNAARIVLKRAIVQVGQGMPELRPVEAGPLPPQSTEVASLAVEAGTIRVSDSAESPRL